MTMRAYLWVPPDEKADELKAVYRIVCEQDNETCRSVLTWFQENRVRLGDQFRTRWGKVVWAESLTAERAPLTGPPSWIVRSWVWEVTVRFKPMTIRCLADICSRRHP